MRLATLVKTMTASAAILGVGITVAYAALSGDDAIKARQECMKGQGKMMGVAVPMMKGEKPYDAAAVTAAIDAAGAGCANWAEFWPEDSMKGTVETYAKPEIWSDKAGFEAAGNKSYTAMQALKTTADEAAFKAAFPAVGDGCQGCHEKFRRPKE
ncbi:MAG: cytochrome c [Rhizobiales bacterium]|nr:cytochrome c [Hyphomicrobiales bacterium]